MGTIKLASAPLIKIHHDVVFEKVSHETVLLHLETGTYYGLDDVGSRMWELLAESGDPQFVARRIQEEYDVTADVVSRDLEALLNELAEKELISVERDRASESS